MKTPLIIIAGPCVVESRDMLFKTAETLLSALKDKLTEFYFKSSYKKANRTSYESFTGIGDIQALDYLRQVGDTFGVKILTDVHSVEEVKVAADYVDVLQIPAFLCRQTELIKAAAETGKTINIKKGQFVGADTMLNAAAKARFFGSENIWITERGTFFGYHDLVVDFRNVIQLKNSNETVIYDATHSVQQPSIGKQSGGRREFIFPLAKAAIAAGVDGIFFETHPDPSKALSDAASQLPLDEASKFIDELIALYENV